LASAAGPRVEAPCEASGLAVLAGPDRARHCRSLPEAPETFRAILSGREEVC
jgi:hypothetical protein